MLRIVELYVFPLQFYDHLILVFSFENSTFVPSSEISLMSLCCYILLFEILVQVLFLWPILWEAINFPNFVFYFHSCWFLWFSVFLLQVLCWCDFVMLLPFVLFPSVAVLTFEGMGKCAHEFSQVLLCILSGCFWQPILSSLSLILNCLTPAWCSNSSYPAYFANFFKKNYSAVMGPVWGVSISLTFQALLFGDATSYPDFPYSIFSMLPLLSSWGFFSL